MAKAARGGDGEARARAEEEGAGGWRRRGGGAGGAGGEGGGELAVEGADAGVGGAGDFGEEDADGLAAGEGASVFAGDGGDVATAGGGVEGAVARGAALEAPRWRRPREGARKSSAVAAKAVWEARAAMLAWREDLKRRPTLTSRTVAELGR